MALLLQHKTDRFHWAVWRMDETSDELIDLLPPKYKEEYGQECRQFASAQRKKEWLSVRALLYSIYPSAGRIAYSPQGKPYLVDHSAFISISHTKGYVAVMLGGSSPVGIDIERYAGRVGKVAGRFLRDDECIPSYRDDRLWGLLLHWSAKETVYKCMENPDADLRKLRLSPFFPGEEGVVHVEEYVTGMRRVFTVGYRLHSDFVLTWTEDASSAHGTLSDF